MSKNQPKVSIIAVCYNHEKYCIETLESINLQTYKNIELIIIDDKSSDNSIIKIENWIRQNNINCKFIKNEKNLGICKTLNKAIEFCTGEFMQMVSCDDIFYLNKIEKQVQKLLEIDNSYGIVYSDADIIDENSNLIDLKFINYNTKYRKAPCLSGNIYEDLAIDNFIPAMSVLIRKVVYEKIGKYDERLIYEDYDFWLRASKDFRFYYMNNTFVKYRIHSENLHKKSNSNRWKSSNILLGIKHINNKNILNKVQKEVIELYFNTNNRSVINEFYANVKINTLKRKKIHFFIKNNYPSFFVKLALEIYSSYNSLKKNK